MARIEGFRVKNFGALKDLTLGKLWNTQEIEPLTPLTAVIGKNGTGKSTLFDAFGFLADALKYGVEDACDARGRGGFEKIRTLGQSGPIEFEVYYREHGRARPITYELAIGTDGGRPHVQRERLRQRRSGQRRGWPFSFLVLEAGKGIAWTGETEGVDESNLDIQALIEGKDLPESAETEFVELQDNKKLGIATLGALKQHPRISNFRRFIEHWHLSYFTPNAARSLPLAGPHKHLNSAGDNLGNVVQFMEREQPRRFKSTLDRIAQRIPGVNHIETVRTDDGRLLLRFNDKGFDDPFYAQQMSDGTLKVFAYLLLLEDPEPSPFLCIEEPENGLYPKLLETLAQEFRAHASGGQGGSQVFITTHQPYFIDALDPEEVWILEKGDNGYSTTRRASDELLVKNLVAEGLRLGALWYSEYLDTK